jgi:hypothetical protein
MSLFFYLKFFYSFYLEEESEGGVKIGIFRILRIVTLMGVGYVGVF